MPIDPISALPTPPSRSSAPATFSNDADTFFNAFPTMVTQINAATAQIPAVVSGIDYNGTSTTSTTIATGSKTFTTQTGKNFQIGQFVVVANTATPANYMTGQITAYTTATGSLTVNVTSIGGSGTFAAWTISISPGAGSYASLNGIETLTNKTLTTPVLSGTAAGTTAGQLGYLSGALTFGNGTAQKTIVTLDDTQTLTNKTINAGTSGNVFKVNGNTLAASAGTATLTLPNTADTLVGRATTDTLTNKTLTSPAVSNPTITGTAREQVYAITDGAAFEISPANGSIQTITLGANRTPKGTNIGAGDSITLHIAATTYTLTWTDTTFGTSGVAWTGPTSTGGSAPTLSSTKATIVTLWKVGTQVYGALVGYA